MKVDLMMDAAGGDVYYSNEFKMVLESHLGYFRRLPTTKLFDIDPKLAYMYEYDLSGLLTAMRVDKKYHWLIMVMNGIKSPFDVTQTLKTLVMPAFSEVEKVKGVYLTKKNLLV